MTTVPLTVVLPIGPMAHHCAWLAECLDSILSQSVQPSELLIIDDMHSLGEHDTCRLRGIMDGAEWNQPLTVDTLNDTTPPFWWIWRAPWRMGNPTGVNFGVSLARYDAVLIMAGDDMLLPGAIQAAWQAYNDHYRQDALYYFGVVYSDGRPNQNIQWGGAMVTKGLWQAMGGYDPWMCPGDADAELCSILMRHLPGSLVAVDPVTPYYWHRIHGESNSSRRDAWNGVMGLARQLVTDQWQAPQWGRFTP